MSASRNKKILWLSPSYGYNGDLMYFYQIFNGFCNYFHNSKVAVDHNFDVDKYKDLPLWPILRNISFNYKRGDFEKKYETTIKLPSVGSFYKIFMTDYDVLITIEFTPLAVAGMIISKLRGKKIIQLIETDASFRFAPKNKGATFVKKFLTFLPNKIITCNEIGRKYIVNVLGASKDKVSVRPYLTSDPNYYKGDEVDVLIRRVNGKINILYFNSVNERKGINCLLETFVNLSASVRDKLLFHIVGSGDKLLDSREYVIENNISDGFEFYGRVDYKDAWRYYIGSDVFISPTLADYRSLGGFEAINMGLPVLVSSRDGACLEVCKNEYNGWIFDPLDRLDFVRVLNDLADNESELVSMGRNSLILAKDFSGDAIINNLVSEVESL